MVITAIHHGSLLPVTREVLSQRRSFNTTRCWHVRGSHATLHASKLAKATTVRPVQRRSSNSPASAPPRRCLAAGPRARQRAPLRAAMTRSNQGRNLRRSRMPGTYYLDNSPQPLAHNGGFVLRASTHAHSLLFASVVIFSSPLLALFFFSSPCLCLRPQDVSASPPGWAPLRLRLIPPPLSLFFAASLPHQFYPRSTLGAA